MNSLLKNILKFSLISIILLTGCSAKKKSGSSDADSISEADLDAARDERFADGSVPTAEGEGLFKDIRFGYDSSSVDAEARADIEANAEILKERSELKITLEGHCDERGTNEYNVALGSQRATAVAEILNALGIESSRVNAISYGEELPLATGQSESAYAQNRRVHFSVHSGMSEPKAKKKMEVSEEPVELSTETTDNSDDSTY